MVREGNIPTLSCCSLDDAFKARVESVYVGLPGKRELEKQLEYYTRDGTFDLSSGDISSLASMMKEALFSCEFGSCLL